MDDGVDSGCRHTEHHSSDSVHNCGEIIQGNDGERWRRWLPDWMRPKWSSHAVQIENEGKNFFGTRQRWQGNLFQFVRFDARCMLSVREYQWVGETDVLYIPTSLPIAHDMNEVGIYHECVCVWMWMWSVAVAMATGIFLVLPVISLRNLCATMR